MLYIIATPIGNLDDITLRALRILKEVDLIAAEDTRTARKLLNSYGIRKPIYSYYDSREKIKTPHLLEKIRSGQKIALISERGMPGISDPGYYLIQQAIAAGIEPIPVPGPSAVLTALVVSGLPVDRFVFEGFLPVRKMPLRKKLLLLRPEERTIIFFESARRLIRTLEELKKIFGERKIAVARELTKKFEQVISGTIPEVLEGLDGREVKGEVVVVVDGWHRTSAGAGLSAARQVRELEVEFGLTRMEAIKLTAELRGVAKNEIYRQSRK